jgi:NhaP-type Na+/H+ or K+/H+ antiporter
MDQTYIILLVLSGIVIVSHFITIFSRKIRIPSVLLFIFLGIVLQFFSRSLNINPNLFNSSLIFFGVLGLILIVFEGALELKIKYHKIRILGSAFGSALLTFLLTTSFLSVYFYTVYQCDLLSAIVNAVPLSVISSAIAISSSSHFSGDKKEFIIYESVLSDIIGILAFSLFVSNQLSITSRSLINLAVNMIIVVAISWFASYALLFLFRKTRIKTKSIFIIAILISAYSIGKILHLPALILVLVFGLFVSNYLLFSKSARRDSGLRKEMRREIRQFKGIVLEITFLIRSYFFILLGFSISVINLIDKMTIVCGVGIVCIVLVIRYIYFKSLLNDRILTEFFIAPRGLVTVLLFYSIPVSQRLGVVNEGTLSFVIIATNLLMIIGTRGKSNVNESY